jgi:hypothetical protein
MKLFLTMALSVCTSVLLQAIPPYDAGLDRVSIMHDTCSVSVHGIKNLNANHNSRKCSMKLFLTMALLFSVSALLQAWPPYDADYGHVSFMQTKSLAKRIPPYDADIASI